MMIHVTYKHYPRETMNQLTRVHLIIVKGEEEHPGQVISLTTMSGSFPEMKGSTGVNSHLDICW